MITKCHQFDFFNHELKWTFDFVQKEEASSMWINPHASNMDKCENFPAYDKPSQMKSIAASSIIG